MTSDPGVGTVGEDQLAQVPAPHEDAATGAPPQRSHHHSEQPPPAADQPDAPPRAELAAETSMQKVVLPGLIDLFLGNVVVPGRFEPHRAAGLVTRLADAPPSTAADLFRQYGLHQVPGWPSTREVHVLRFFAHTTVGYAAPFGRSAFRMELAELPAGTELWRIDEHGGEQRIATYLHRQIGWVTTAPVLMGPGRWNRPPVALAPTVRRGLVAHYRGGDFDADFGPAPGEVTLHPQPGLPAPSGFSEQVGARFLVVAIPDLEALTLVRWRGTWRGLPVELVHAAGEQLSVQFQGEDGQRASDSGLAEVDYRVWRGLVPRAEVAEVHDEATPLHP